MRFHIQQESDIPASTQLYNQICFAIAARHYPPGHRLPSTRQLAMQTGLHRNTISKVYRQLETDGVVEAMAGSGIYVRDQQKPREIRTPPHIRNRGVTGSPHGNLYTKIPTIPARLLRDIQRHVSLL